MQLRKHILQGTAADSERWIPIADVAVVCVSSEDPAHPIEHALADSEGPGWRATQPGRQTIRLEFDHPQDIGLIHLVFEETQAERTHEFMLQWSRDGGRTFHPIVRQQFSFSPAGATRQREDYNVQLSGVTVLELQMVADTSQSSRVATLKALRLR